MKLYFCIFTVFLSIAWNEAFFLFSAKPLLFCLKVCPLYCSPRRQDIDASSLYFDDEPEPYPSYPHFDDHEYEYHSPYHFGHFVYCKPKPTTTTPKPTTTTMAPTTEEPTFICSVCMKKCDFKT